MDQQVNITSGKGFKYIHEIIHVSTYQRITAQVRYVPNPKTMKIHHADLIITKETKTPKQSWDDAETTKIIFTSEDSKSLQKLMMFIKAQPVLSRYYKAKLSVLDSKEAELIDGTSREDFEFIQKVLMTFNSPDKKSLLVRAKKDDVNNLYAAVKQAKSKKALLELKNLMKIEVHESQLHDWIKNNPWIFGIEYLRFLDSSKIGIHADSDFIVESLDGYANLIELKKSVFKLFKYDSSHDSYYGSTELSQVLGQAIKYLKVMEESRHLLKDADDIDVLKPRIKIVIGKSSEMGSKEKEALRLLNDTLHNIEIMTYDEILKRAEKLIAYYEKE